MSYTNYYVITNYDLEEFEQKVMDFITDGYELVGGISIFVPKYKSALYHQAVKREFKSYKEYEKTQGIT